MGNASGIHPQDICRFTLSNSMQPTVSMSLRTFNLAKSIAFRVKRACKSFLFFGYLLISWASLLSLVKWDQDKKMGSTLQPQENPLEGAIYEEPALTRHWICRYLDVLPSLRADSAEKER